MHKKTLFCILVVFVCFTTVASAQYVPYAFTPHDVGQFDIAGVKLRMTQAEALAAVKESLGVTDNQIDAQQDYQESRVTQKRELSYYSIKTDNIEMMISFGVQVPPNLEEPVIVQGVTFKMSGDGQITETMRARALEKYGTPTTGRVSDPAHFQVEWCNWPEGDTTGSCTTKEGAYLVFDGGRELNMRDPDVDREMVEFLNNKPVSKPKF